MRLRLPVVHVDCGTDGFAEMVGSVTVVVAPVRTCCADLAYFVLPWLGGA